MLLMVSSALRNFKVFCTTILAPSSLPCERFLAYFLLQTYWGIFWSWYVMFTALFRALGISSA